MTPFHRAILGGSLLLSTAAIAPTAPAFGQLLSPGELTIAHASLEGVTQCTSCHTIGGQGVDAAKCLDCHRPIRDRIEGKSGLHATFQDPCVTCHKEHLGRRFQIVRLDTTTFEHTETGFELLGAHSRTSCSSCHNSDRLADRDVIQALERGDIAGTTYLGLDNECDTCHRESSPHEDQFEGKQCSDCHSVESWKERPPFDHAGTSFPLAGRHSDVACEKCHPQTTGPGGRLTTTFVGIRSAECSNCHADPHASKFGTSCGSCHSPNGWSRITSERSFRHAQTGYALTGAHAALSCGACHRRPARNDEKIRIAFIEPASTRSYPAIAASTCLSCHVDYHQGSFRAESAGQACDHCHRTDGWIPTTYGIDRHNETSRFQLDGGHLSVQCDACHRAERTKATFHFEERDCDSCHRNNSPHGTQFDSLKTDRSCGSCHNTTAWNSNVDFDHTATTFSLLGAHANLSCTACHVPSGDINVRSGIDYSGLKTDCVSCHAAIDPHRGQFAGRDCSACHDETGFVPVSSRFDHDSTRFALSGAHGKIPCSACHQTTAAPEARAFTRYLIGKNQCIDCHSSD